MNQQEIKHLTTDEGEELLSHYRTTINKDGRQVSVPVVDVRDGWTYRAMAYQMIKASNRSKYMNYTEYHKSHKKENYGTSM